MLNTILYIVIFLFVILRVMEISSEIKSRCPVCGNGSHWEQRYWGADKYYDEEYCTKCKRSLRDLKTGELKTFDEPQDWI